MPVLPNVRRRALKAALALVTLTMAVTMAGCGWDGPAPGVKAVAPPTVAPGDAAAAASGAGGEVAAEASADPGHLVPDGSVPVVAPASPPAHLPQASLPAHIPLPDELPDTVAIVGDSLTLSAKDEITAYMTGLGIDVLAIDGAVNRRMTHGSNPDPGIDIVDRIKSVAKPDLWVIALGTNDVGAEVSSDQFAHDVDTLLDAIPSGAPVVWVDTFIRDRQPQVDTANDVLRTTVGKRADTIVADWFSHGDDPGLVGGDGVHLTDDGRYMFAATIAAATVDLFD